MSGSSTVVNIGERAKRRGDSAESKAGMNTDRKTLKQVVVDDSNECDDRSSIICANL